MAKTKYKRILLKLSGEAMLGKREYGIDPAVCDYLAQEIKELVANKIEVVIVLGGGNIFRGLSGEKQGMKRITGEYLGMMATVMNSLALGSALTNIGVENRVQSALEMPQVCETYIRDKALSHLAKGRVVIVGAGSGHPYFTTDTAAAIRACELDCEVLFKATKVDGVYDQDPVKFPAAKKFEELGYLDVINDGLDVMDATAITLCRDNKIPILVFKLMETGNILKAAGGEKIGTIIQG